MIMRSPTPYVPQRPISVPAPANNFHLRQPRRRRQGMGDVCVSGPYGSDASGPLCMDQTTGSPVSCSDPRCGTGGGGGGTPASNTPTYIPQNNPTFSTQQFGSSTTTTFTLDSYLSQWVAGVTGQSLASLANQGMGSVAAIIAQLSAVAQQYCQVESPSDCGNMSAIVAKYAAMITSAYSNVNPAQWNPATFTAYAAPTPAPTSQPGPSVPLSTVNVTPAVLVPAPVTPPPVVNPPAAQSNTVNQMTVGSGAAQSNTFNPASILPDVSSVPDWVWYAGGGLIALVVISSLVKR